MTCAARPIVYVFENRSRQISDPEFRAMLLAYRLAALDFAADWRTEPVEIRASDEQRHRHHDEIEYRSIFVDAPSDPTAIAFHTEDEHGNVTVEIAVDQVTKHGGGILDGGTSGEAASAAGFHEVTEADIDPHVNLWADRFDGHEVALEVSDPVQADTIPYVVTYQGRMYTVLVSSWVLPDWFDPQCPEGRPVDRKGLCKGPFQLARGGYQVVMTSANDAAEEFGEHVRRAMRKSFEKDGHIEEDEINNARVAFVHFHDDVPEWKRARLRHRAERRIRKVDNRCAARRSVKRGKLESQKAGSLSVPRRTHNMETIMSETDEKAEAYLAFRGKVDEYIKREYGSHDRLVTGHLLDPKRFDQEKWDNFQKFYREALPSDLRKAFDNEHVYKPITKNSVLGKATLTDQSESTLIAGGNVTAVGTATSSKIFGANSLTNTGAGVLTAAIVGPGGLGVVAAEAELNFTITSSGDDTGGMAMTTNVLATFQTFRAGAASNNPTFSWSIRRFPHTV